MRFRVANAGVSDLLWFSLHLLLWFSLRLLSGSVFICGPEQPSRSSRRSHLHVPHVTRDSKSHPEIARISRRGAGHSVDANASNGSGAMSYTQGCSNYTLATS